MVGKASALEKQAACVMRVKFGDWWGKGFVIGHNELHPFGHNWLGLDHKSDHNYFPGDDSPMINKLSGY